MYHVLNVFPVDDPLTQTTLEQENVSEPVEDTSSNTSEALHAEEGKGRIPLINFVFLS